MPRILRAVLSIIAMILFTLSAVLAMALFPEWTMGSSAIGETSPAPKPQTCVVQRCGLQKGVLINCEPVEIMNSQELAKLIQATTGGAVKWECKP